MTLLVTHWSFDPFLIVAAVVVVLHARGLHKLNRTAPRRRVRRRRRQGAWFYLGIAVLLVAVASPIDYWSDRYFWMHMVQHLLLIFGAPVPIVRGAPWIPLEHGLPVGARRALVRWVARGRTASPIRRAARAAWWPWVGVVGLDVALVFWHLPAPFDLAEENPMVHVWLMHGSFFVFGVLFWLQFIDSHPFKVRLSPAEQIGTVFSTACVMWLLAMALSMLSKGSWYTWYQVHEGPLLSPFADQQIGAGIMWICGDFWAIPAMVRAVRRLIDQRGDERMGGAARALYPARRSFGITGRVHAEIARRDAAGELGPGPAARDVQPVPSPVPGPRRAPASAVAVPVRPPAP